MNKFQINAAIAGICFGLYPLLLNRSNLTGNIASSAFCFLVFTLVTPFAVGEISNLKQACWPMLIGAAVFSAGGMLFMTSYLSKASPASVSILIVIMLVAQAVVTALNQAYIEKGISPFRFLGFALAAMSIVLLTKK